MKSYEIMSVICITKGAQNIVNDLRGKDISTSLSLSVTKPGVELVYPDYQCSLNLCKQIRLGLSFIQSVFYGPSAVLVLKGIRN